MLVDRQQRRRSFLSPSKTSRFVLSHQRAARACPGADVTRAVFPIWSLRSVRKCSLRGVNREGGNSTWRANISCFHAYILSMNQQPELGVHLSGIVASYKKRRARKRTTLLATFQVEIKRSRACMAHGSTKADWCSHTTTLVNDRVYLTATYSVCDRHMVHASCAQCSRHLSISLPHVASRDPRFRNGHIAIISAARACAMIRVLRCCENERRMLAKKSMRNIAPFFR